MNWLRTAQAFVTPTRASLAVVTVLVYSTFTIAALSGGNIALGGEGDLSTASEEMDAIDETVLSNIHSKYGGLSGEAVAFLMGPVLAAVEWAGQTGLHFGYQHPRMAELNGQVAPLVVVGIGVVMVFHQFRRLGFASSEGGGA